MSQARLEFWYEFAWTYSYLSAMRIEALAAVAGVTIIWKPLLLGPIFRTQGWGTSPFNIYPAKGKYMVRDLERLATARGLPFKLPSPFPQNSLHAARLALVGHAEGWGPAFTRAVYEAEFAHGRQHLGQAPARRPPETPGSRSRAPLRSLRGVRQQAAPAPADRGGAGARHFRCAVVSRRRRAVLGR